MRLNRQSRSGRLFPDATMPPRNGEDDETVLVFVIR